MPSLSEFMDSSTPMVAARPTTMTMDCQKRWLMLRKLRAETMIICRIMSSPRQCGCDIHSLQPKHWKSRTAKRDYNGAYQSPDKHHGCHGRDRNGETRRKQPGHGLGEGRRRADAQQCPNDAGNSGFQHDQGQHGGIGKPDRLEGGKFSKALAHRLGDDVGSQEQDHE